MGSTTYRHDPRMDAKILAETDARFKSVRERLLDIASHTKVGAARLRVKWLIIEVRRNARQDNKGLVAILESLLKKPKSDAGGYEECVICGASAVRCLRKPPYPAVCEKHSLAPARARDLRRIHAVLRDPPPEFFEALVVHESAIMLTALHDEMDPGAMAPVWRRHIATPLSARGSTGKVLSLWRACCDPYTDSSYQPDWKPPELITASLWCLVSEIAHARDAEASVRNGQQGGGRPRDKRQEKEIVRLAKRGLKQVEIAAKIRTTQCQVSRVLRRLRVL